jgi:hypothetical protein
MTPWGTEKTQEPSGNPQVSDSPVMENVMRGPDSVTLTPEQLAAVLALIQPT